MTVYSSLSSKFTYQSVDPIVLFQPRKYFSTVIYRYTDKIFRKNKVYLDVWTLVSVNDGFNDIKRGFFLEVLGKIW